MERHGGGNDVRANQGHDLGANAGRETRHGHDEYKQTRTHLSICPLMVYSRMRRRGSIIIYILFFCIRFHPVPLVCLFSALPSLFVFFWIGRNVFRVIQHLCGTFLKADERRERAGVATMSRIETANEPRPSELWRSEQWTV